MGGKNISGIPYEDIVKALTRMSGEISEINSTLHKTNDLLEVIAKKYNKKWFEKQRKYNYKQFKKQ